MLVASVINKEMGPQNTNKFSNYNPLRTLYYLIVEGTVKLLLPESLLNQCDFLSKVILSTDSVSKFEVVISFREISCGGCGVAYAENYKRNKVAVERIKSSNRKIVI